MKPRPLRGPPSMGHRFDPQLICSECETRWHAHQKNAISCQSTREQTAMLASDADGEIQIASAQAAC